MTLSGKSIFGTGASARRYATLVVYTAILSSVMSSASAQTPPTPGDTGDSAPPPGIQLIEDPHFQLGLVIYDPKQGAHVIRGKFGPGNAEGEPAWGLAQWDSRFRLENATPETLPGGAIRLTDGAKTVMIAPPDSPDADLVLAIDSSVEYENRARKQGQPWPHLLVEQDFAQRCPRLTELDAVWFRLETRLRQAERIDTPEYDQGLHAAQFLMYLTVQNQNRDSAGFGDFLWLGVPIYDDRGGYTELTVFEGDVALNKLIYTPARHTYTDKPMRQGEWITFEADMLPMALDALKEAWKRGFLKGSQDPADYTLSGMNIGWEMPGLNRVTIQIRNLSLKTVRSSRRQ